MLLLLICTWLEVRHDMIIQSYTDREESQLLFCLNPLMTCLGKQMRDEPALRHLNLQENQLHSLPVPLPIELKVVIATAELSVAVRPPLARGSLNTSGAISGQRSVYPLKDGSKLLIDELTCMSPTAPLQRRHSSSIIRCSHVQAKQVVLQIAVFFELLFDSCCQCFAFR